MRSLKRPVPTPPRQKTQTLVLHPTHRLVRKNSEGYVCLECERCTCHRPISLGFICPSQDLLPIKDEPEIQPA